MLLRPSHNPIMPSSDQFICANVLCRRDVSRRYKANSMNSYDLRRLFNDIHGRATLLRLKAADVALAKAQAFLR